MANSNAGDVLYLNLADADALAGTGLDPAAAQGLVKGRPYASWTDVERLSGLDREVLNQLRSQGAQLGVPSEGPINEPGSGGSGGSPQGNPGHA
jgi:hypothetical protein